MYLWRGTARHCCEQDYNKSIITTVQQGGGQTRTPKEQRSLLQTPAQHSRTGLVFSSPLACYMQAGPLDSAPFRSTYIELNTNRQEQASDPTHCTFDSADGLGRRCDFSFSP